LVSLEGNSGVVNPTSLSLTTGASYGTLPVPTRTGYSFTGWELNGVVVTSQTKVLNSSNHTLIAKWVGNTYLITFDANGGSVNPTSQNVVFGTTYGTLPVPTRTGYTFTGWDLNGELIKETSTVSSTSNHTLIARWYQQPTSGYGPNINDVDGNSYKTVYIGAQHWMGENLKVSKYNDGTEIPNIIDNTIWSNLTSGAWTHYNNDTMNNLNYGKLYNWYAVSPTTNGNKNVCPVGWHVPSDVEWTVLMNYLGGRKVAGGKMKEVGTTSWMNSNTNVTNTSLFTGLPGGIRKSIGYCDYIGYNGYLWSVSEEYNTINAYSINLTYSDIAAYRFTNDKKEGLSIRCLKD
jgi:uncharacterized protein (TIGR02145 family)/uncharacterized repeat protein (TIGR02543 family)